MLLHRQVKLTLSRLPAKQLTNYQTLLTLIFFQQVAVAVIGSRLFDGGLESSGTRAATGPEASRILRPYPHPR